MKRNEGGRKKEGGRKSEGEWEGTLFDSVRHSGTTIHLAEDDMELFGQQPLGLWMALSGWLWLLPRWWRNAT